MAPPMKIGPDESAGTLIPQAIKDSISKNDLDSVVFEDPFSEDTRKAKRNLMAAAFVALLISIYQLEVSGIAGLSISAREKLGPQVTQGIACLTTAYFLVSFCFSAFVDYVAWKFTRERLLVKPYTDLLHLIESNSRVLPEQIGSARESLARLEREPRGGSEQTSQWVLRAVSDAKMQLNAIVEHQSKLRAELTPLLNSWEEAVRRSGQLSWRIWARFMSLWLLDLGLPVALGFFALSHTYKGVLPVIGRFFG